MTQVNVPITQKGKSRIIDRGEFGIPSTLPDLAFLRRLSIEGRLRFFQANGSDDITITPNEGETFFFLGAIYSHNEAANTTIFTITNDGNVREIITAIALNTGAGPSIFQSALKMDSLVGNGTKTFTITANRDSAEMSAFGWVENTSRIRDATI